MITVRLARAIAAHKVDTRREGTPPTHFDLQFLLTELLVALIRENEGDLTRVESIVNTAQSTAEYEVFGEARS